MNTKNFLRAIMVIIIIIGGVIIIIINRPDPPPCLVCGENRFLLLGISEIILGVVSLFALGRLNNEKQGG